MKAEIKFWTKNNVTRYYVSVDGQPAGCVKERAVDLSNSIHDYSLEIADADIAQRFAYKFSTTTLEGKKVIDIVKIKQVAANQPTLKRGKILMSKGQIVEL